MSTEKKQGYITGNKRKINDAVTCDCCQENLRVKRNHIKLRDLYIEQLEEERDDLQQQVNSLTEKCTGYKKAITDARSKLNLGNDEEADDILAVLFCNKGGVEMIDAMEVVRNEHGYWTHPVYNEFCDGREYIAPDEFNQWLESQGMQWTVQYRDEDELAPNVDGYDISTWQPEPPEGGRWFVASIHDTEDGAVCIWLRAAKAAEEVIETREIN